MTEPKRVYYPDGTLLSETVQIGDRERLQLFSTDGKLDREMFRKDGLPDGVTRMWHPNGVLAKETPVTMGLTNGIVKSWNDKGELLGSCELLMGTGTHRTWFQNGQLNGETDTLTGAPHGRLRCWYDDGELAGTQYFIRGKKVSKKKYLEAAANDPTLPRCAAIDAETPPTAEPAIETDHTSPADYPDARNALEWLQESPEESIRTLGELPSAESSIELVNEFLAEKVVRVLVVAIQSEDDGQTTSQLLVELPTKPVAARNRALAFCNEKNSQCGFSPVKDTGQQFVHVAVD